MKRVLLALALSSLTSGIAAAQDMEVSRIAQGGDYRFWGQSGGIAAYSFATTSCNVGNQEVLWNDGIGQAPVIGQNMFRIHDGRIEQLGYSWLKYGFCAVNENSCGNCQFSSCDTLGLGCADTYSSGLNDGSFGGAKFQINSTNGGPWPNNVITATGLLPLEGRLQVKTSEFAQPGDIYIAEAQYITQHDQEAGNGRNNCTWREMDVQSLSNVSNGASNMRGDPAIFAWRDLGGATINEVPNVDEGGPGIHGYWFVGYNVTQIPGPVEQWRYEYAVQNMNSDRQGGSFSIPISPADNVVVSDLFFRDVDGHSGEINASTDWSVETDFSDGFLTWSTDSFDQDPLANSLRWGTIYNFGFTADVGPVNGQAVIGLFIPGTPDVLRTEVDVPGLTDDCLAVNYCQTAPNSAGDGAVIDFLGSLSVSANEMTLRGFGGPVGKSGLFYYGPSQINVPFGDGFRCVGGTTQRLNPPLSIDGAGNATRATDFNSPPMNSGPNAIVPGATFNFQLWFRDPMGPGGQGFNLSDGLELTFCP